VVAVLASAVLLAAGCDRNPVFLRLSADYYPVSAIGSVWEYSVEGGGTRIVTVVDQVIVDQRPCYRLQSGAGYDYWINEDGLLEHYEDRRVLFNGYEVPVYQAWVTYLEWPLADGMSRRDSASAQAVSQGITLSHTWIRNTAVSGPENSPDGVWSQCYRVHQEETVINWVQTAGYDPDTSYMVRDIWLAPDVGMVAKITPDSTVYLSSFTPGR
jgi:hypothetical protein